MNGFPIDSTFAYIPRPTNRALVTIRKVALRTLRKRSANSARMAAVWVVDPGHPIAECIGPSIELEQSEMYGELFGIPSPDELVFISWFQGGEVFRSGCCWRRGSGRVFYFSPGHHSNPIYHHPQIQPLIVNAVKWARPHGRPADTPKRLLIPTD